MADSNQIVYCVSCSRPMMSEDPVCPGCGVVQALARRENTFLPSEGVRCPGCGRSLLPGAGFCAYCGAPSAPVTPEARRAYAVYIGLGLILSVIALLGNCPPLFGLLAALMAVRAKQRDSRHWAGPFLLGAAVAATALGSVVFLLKLFNSLSSGLF